MFMRQSSTDQRNSGHDVLARIAQEAMELHGVTPTLAQDACRITGQRLSHLMHGSPSTTEQDRLYAYFWGVVRRCSIDSRGLEHREMRERYLVSSVVSDLRRAGRSGSDIVTEIESSYRDTVTPEVLHEFRLLLCG